MRVISAVDIVIVVCDLVTQLHFGTLLPKRSLVTVSRHLGMLATLRSPLHLVRQISSRSSLPLKHTCILLMSPLTTVRWLASLFKCALMVEQLLLRVASVKRRKESTRL